MANVLQKVPVNWQLLANPVNWVIVWLMIAIGCAAFAVLDSASHYNMGNDNGR